MKNKILFPLFLVSLIGSFFLSCKKGEDIGYAVFSTLEIEATLSTNTKLVVDVDETTPDTIRGSGISKFNVNSGERRVVIRDGNKIWVDTTLLFEKYQTKRLTKFFYTGTSLLFADPDTTRKPATPGNVLIRFVITAPTLPEAMNIDISFFYQQAGTRKIVPMNKPLNNVRKDLFSDYIELPNPASLLPTGATSPSYAIIGKNAVTGEQVMNIVVTTSSTENTFATVRYSSSSSTITYIPNSVISLGIDEPQNTSTKIRQSKVIFSRIAQ